MPAFTSLLLAANTLYGVSEGEKAKSDAKNDLANQKVETAEAKKVEDDRKRAGLRTSARNSSTYKTNYSSGASSSSITGMGSQTLGG